MVEVDFLVLFVASAEILLKIHLISDICTGCYVATLLD